MPYFKIIRPINLAMIVLTQLLFWFFIIVPIHKYYGSIPDLAIWQVCLLVLSTVLIAAGGYVINDYYDLPLDLVNKPNKVLIGKYMSDDHAFNYYMFLSGTGLVCSLIVAISLSRFSLVMLPVIISSLLWFYAQVFKRMFLVGNFVVALSTAAVIFILIYFEIDWERIERIPNQAKQIMIFGGVYMIFAFITSMLRELIKDIQDKEGDAAFDCKTMPIVAGIKVSKIVSAIYIFILLVGISYCLYVQIEVKKWLEGAYLFFLLILPSLLILYKIIIAKKSDDYSVISTLVKAVMFFGIVTLIYIGLVI